MATWTTTIDLDAEIIGTDSRIITAGRWLDPFSWDSINYALTLPKKYSKILALYIDGVIAKSVPYDVLKGLSANNLYYTSISNHLYFNTDLDATTEDIKIKVRADYPIPLVTDEEYDGMPDSAEAMLINGILSVLYSQPQHYDDRLQALHRRQFEDDLYAFNVQVMTKQPQEHQDPEYTY